MSETHLFEAYVCDCLRRWGREFPLGEERGGHGYPTRSTVYVAMRFAGRSPRSNVAPPTCLDATAWLVEQIVGQISTYEPRMALVLRAAFCARGSWAERLAIAVKARSRSERVLCGSRGVFYRERKTGIDEVGWYQKRIGES